jgi:hypothetical protein
MKKIAAVAGYLVRYPLGGHVFAQLQFLVGLQKLGFDVVFIEHFGWPNSCYDASANAMTDDPAYGLAQIQKIFGKFGVQKWCFVDARGAFHGLSRDEVKQICRDATALISIASVTWLDEFYECKTRAFIDTDPAFTQFRMPPKPSASCAGYASPHDFQFHFTYGERIGKSDCPIPTRELKWQPTRQPIVLDLVIPRFAPDAKFFTTVMSWTSYGSVEFGGEAYGQKDVELLKLLDLPQKIGPIFEIALGGPNAPAEKLRAAGWKISSALDATVSVDSYLDYIGNSRGEFSVAKNGYVKTRSGWFSDRTAAYLAMGKPAIVQDTGFSEILPCGDGLFAFQTADDVAKSVEKINADYENQCRAARKIAEKFFDSDKILGNLVRFCGI